jgi:hypothetical protein
VLWPGQVTVGVAVMSGGVPARMFCADAPEKPPASTAATPALTIPKTPNKKNSSASGFDKVKSGQRVVLQLGKKFQLVMQIKMMIKKNVRFGPKQPIAQDAVKVAVSKYFFAIKQFVNVLFLKISGKERLKEMPIRTVFKSI